MSMDPGGFALDVKRMVITPFSVSGDKNAERAFSLSIGITSSILEAAVFEQLSQTSGKGVSAAHIIRFANTHGIPVFQITQANLSAIRPLLALPPEIREDIEALVLAGRTVIVPATEVTISGWKGAGYFAIDSITGAGAFQISGGLAGSFCFMGTDFCYSYEQRQWATLFYIGLAAVFLLPLDLAAIIAGVAISLFLLVVTIYLDNKWKNRDPWTIPRSQEMTSLLISWAMQQVLGLTLGLVLAALATAAGPVAVTLAVIGAIFIFSMITIDRLMSEVYSPIGNVRLAFGHSRRFRTPGNGRQIA